MLWSVESRVRRGILDLCVAGGCLPKNGGEGCVEFHESEKYSYNLDYTN